MTASIAASSVARAGRITRPSGKRDVRGIFLFHADSMVTGIDMMRFARDARRQIPEQVKRRTAHIVDRDIAAQRAMMLVPLEDQAYIAHFPPPGRLDRARPDRVLTHPPRARPTA